MEAQIRLLPILVIFSSLELATCNQYKKSPLSILDQRKPEQYHMQTQDGHYEYGYSTGNSAKYEIRTKDGLTRGAYSYTDPNAVLRVTNYMSDISNGYRAKSTEHGTPIDSLDTLNIYTDETNKPDEKSRSTKNKYLYIPYVINHGYDMKENKNSDDENSMVGHELARITIPISEDLDRTGKSLSDYKDINPNEFIVLETNENAYEGSGAEEDSSTNGRIENEENASKSVGSYSYLDANGDMQTTNDVSEVAIFGFKTISLKTPENTLAAPVASKICDHSSKIRTSKTTKVEVSSPAANAYISHLLYYGYENELPFDESNQVVLENVYKLKNSRIANDRTEYSREIRINNIASETPPTVSKNGDKGQIQPEATPTATIIRKRTQATAQRNQFTTVGDNKKQPQTKKRWQEKHIGRKVADKNGPIAEKYISEEIIDENVPTKLKSLGKWRPEGKCISRISGSNCGDGFQVMIRECSDGTVQKCTPTDRKTNRQCRLVDCPKKLGEWKDGGVCLPNDKIKKCGQGKKLQTRKCSEGTNDACRISDTNRYKNCFIECKRKFGPWIKGNCEPKRGSQNCGVGQQIERRSCVAGTNEPCLNSETTKTNPCFLGDCIKKLGDWKDKGTCIPNDVVKKCGVGQKLQQRSCEDGTKDICTSRDTTQYRSCFIECKKKLGPWVKSECVARVGNQDCGFGQQIQTRTCESGTNDPCLYSETRKTTRCYIGKCLTVSKKFGEWSNEEICKPFDFDKKCGNGQQLQTRICQDGTIDICKAEETIRYINCYIECESFAPNYEPLVEVAPENSELFNGKTEITITEQLEGVPQIGTRSFFEEEEIDPVAQNSNAAKKSRELFPDNISNYPTITSKLNDPISTRNNAVDCILSQWVSQPCSASCGESGVQKMTRRVIQRPLYGGKPCQELEKIEKCKDIKPCPVDCQWSSWSYGKCSKSCGNGKRGRTRTKALTEKFGGSCDGPSFVYEDCFNKPCPIDGKFSEWRRGSCQTLEGDTCGVNMKGIQKLTRTCSNPKPQFGGKDCEGRTEKVEECELDPCPPVCITGHCLKEDGTKLKRAYVDLPGQYSKKDCLSECQRKRKTVGYKMSACEFMRDGSCRIHTLPASSGNSNKTSTCCIYDSEFNYVSKECPKKFPGTQPKKIRGDSKNYVRCCSENGGECSSEECNTKITYLQASQLCSKRGKRLCYKRELNQCCNTGCTLDNASYWVKPECKSDQFECDSGVCIDKGSRCDGNNDCNVNPGISDYSDEDFCDLSTKGGYKCEFPFIYDGKEYSRCTTAGGYDPWCGYSVNNEREMYNGYWDYCKYD